MKILQICSKPPFPQVDGGTIAMQAISKGLYQQKEVELSILTIQTTKHPSDPKQALAELPTIYYESVFVDTKLSIGGFISSFLKNSSYNIDRFYSRELKNKLKALLTKTNFDVILLEGLYVSPYIETIREYSKAKIIYRSHNIEYLIWERLSAEKKFLKKYVLNYLSIQIKKKEKKVFQQVDSIAAISTIDAQIISQTAPHVPIRTIPIGINIPAKQTTTSSNALCYIGSFDWAPNVEGVNWFIEKVWPLVLEKNKNVIIKIAGRAVEKHFYHTLPPNIIIEGTVADAHQFLQENGIMIIPLFSGSGTRVKLIEGMMLGKTIITTPIGAEGIMVENNKHVIIAENETTFAQSILTLLNQPDSCRFISEQAQLFAHKNYNQEAVTQQLLQFFKYSLEPNKG